MTDDIEALRKSVEARTRKESARARRAERMAAARAKGTHTKDEWERIVARYEGRCVCCGYRGPDGWRPTKDHIISVADGGSDAAKNLQPLCRNCNTANRSGTNWRRYRDRHGWADAAFYEVG